MFTNNYEPTSFDDLVFQNDIARKRLERHALGEAKGNILLYGPSGSAKSTTARIIANQARKQVDFGFELPVDVVNCANFEPEQLVLIERGWHMSGQDYAYAVFEEFDLLDPRLQFKVRDLMDRNWGKHGLILTTNRLHRIDIAIQSRCAVVEMPALEAKTFLPKCQEILAAEGIRLADEHVLSAIEHEHGDIRGVLRQLEDVVDRVKRR